MKHGSIYLRAGVYFLMVLFVKFGETFRDVGAAKLHDFLWSDWLCEITVALGFVFITMNAYFDRSFATHMENGGGNSAPPKPVAPPPPAPASELPKLA